ncbi:MarR family winged helix-turn-helix transcriptional regulator [Catenuloplanes atrovinosus]|uniref:DNA-binding MarR family transcriptional regulator n=1 Tax=Catenuloplanes atrovinosus TaxID=137266 RepID=A0AAE4C890_9ACTN|nr:MarR family transcriptional regulator [Catenuloplanes atrovinosus]MDR7275276.1 DNA-binding MarR family transcriptional regulator [Catenuloplanes atrovinosus]
MSDDLDLAEALRAAVGDFVRRVRPLEAMPPGQLAALGHLHRDGALSIADLARREAVRHQSMTRTVGLLADQHLVTLRPDALDRRQVVVVITPAGTIRLTEARRARAAVIAGTLTHLTPAERDIAARIPEILRKLTP